MRHFLSSDHGANWIDRGAILIPGTAGDGADARNVWSGSVTALQSGKFVFAYTGIRDCGPSRPFLQTICIATGTAPGAIKAAPREALSCPHRDYDNIRALGYYLGPRDGLGSSEGEQGGPIMAWRDPFVFRAHDNSLRAVWSAKIAPTIPAIANAILEERDGAIQLAELLAPIRLPDEHLMTQAEVPKVYWSSSTAEYLLLVSA